VIRLKVNADNAVAQLRRRAAHQQAEQDTMRNRMGTRLPLIPGVSDVNPGQPGRQLDVRDGQVTGTANPRQ
jgi:hypothetical protein